MRVDLKKIGHAPRRFDQTLNARWWERVGDGDAVLGFEGPLNASTEISKAGERYVLEGRLKGSLRVLCDRCAEPYVRKLDVAFRLFLALPPGDGFDEETALRSEDMAGDFIPDDTLELDDIIREQIYLAAPMKSLCRDSCKGLCADCGANLNEGDCGCRNPRGRPEFEALKKLTFEGD